MNRWTSFICIAFLVGGCADQDTTVSEVQFFTFHADWCGPCKTQEPIVERLERDFTGVTFHHVDVDVQSELTRKYKVDGVPCMVITVDGKETERFKGVSSYADLSAALSKYSGTNKGADGRIQQGPTLAAHP